MVKHTQTIRIDLSVFDHIMGLVLKGLKTYSFTCVIAYITKISTPPPPWKLSPKTPSHHKLSPENPFHVKLPHAHMLNFSRVINSDMTNENAVPLLQLSPMQ